MEILAVKNLTFRYPLCEEYALRDVSFEINKGDFVAVCGSTGSGKSTLMRCLKRELTPLGEKNGQILFMGRELDEIDEKTSAVSIGYVAQRPEEQIVTDTVWHEMAFGLENMNMPREVIRRRISEMACYFGIESWFDKKPSELSGGQKQLLNLASVMVMQPEILILDEPTAQLDPITAADFISTVAKLNRELSLTVIITEHRTEDVIPVADKLIAMEHGKIIAFGNTRDAAQKLMNSSLRELMPSPLRLYYALSDAAKTASCPLTVKEGREFVTENFANEVKTVELCKYTHSDKTALEFDDVWFRYSREGRDILRGLSFKVYENEIYCILGSNGSGKSTALSCASAVLKPYSGKIKVFGRKLADYKNNSLYNSCTALLPQDVQTVFLRNTVREELSEVPDTASLPFDIDYLSDRHPYDISGGEQQLVALAKVLGTKPRLLYLDEPTKGLDAQTKKNFTQLMRKLRESGITIVAVTHDVEFAAECADRCAMFFRGEITSEDTPSEFFMGNSFYTTAANRMTRGYYENVVTIGDAVSLCLKNGRR